MIIDKIPTDERTKLLMVLYKLTSSYSKRGVSFVINAHSEYVGDITILVTGKLGTAQKSVVLVYNQLTSEWEGYSDGYVFKMLTLNELSTIIKSKINNLSTLLLKI